MYMGCSIGKRIAELCSRIVCKLSCGNCFRFEFDNKDCDSPHHCPPPTSTKGACPPTPRNSPMYCDTIIVTRSI